MPRPSHRIAGIPPITTATRPRQRASPSLPVYAHDRLLLVRFRARLPPHLNRRAHAVRNPSHAERTAPAADQLVAATQPGLIISNYGATLQFDDANGGIHRCTARKKVDALVCGDRGRWQPTKRDEDVN